jgi:hypothetical protein
MRLFLSLQAKASIIPFLSLATLFSLFSAPDGTFDQPDLSVLESGVPIRPASSREASLDASRRHENGEPATRKTKKKKKRLLVVAAAPKDERHLLAAWSQLECYTQNVDQVVISAPKWGKKVIGQVLKHAKSEIPNFKTGAVSLKSEFYVNNRYDVGLWCDALKNHPNLDDFDEFGLVNDSIFALREFSGVFDALDEKNISMSSLSYSYSAKHFKSYGPEHYWLESVFRGFDREGIRKFIDYSCVPVTHPFFCRKKSSWKACIIHNFEHEMARQFSRDKVGGLFPTDVPLELITKDGWLFRSWIQHVPFWRLLVDHMGFPAAKVIVRDGSNGKLVTGVQDPILRNCTRYLDRTIFKEIENTHYNR